MLKSVHNNTFLCPLFFFIFLMENIYNFYFHRLSGLENGLLGLSSRVDAVMWSKTINDIENIDIICFGHLLFEMCAGYELNAPQPTAGHIELDLNRYPQVYTYIYIYVI